MPLPGPGAVTTTRLARRLYVVVLAEAVVRDDKGEVGGIVRYPVLHIDAHVHGLQPLAEHVGGLLAAVVRDADAAHVEADGAEGVYEPQRVLVVGDAEVPAALAALHVVGRDDYHYLRLVLHLEEHAHLAVRLEARQHARGVVVVEELAAELQVELPAEAADALAYLLRLQADVFLVVKAYLGSYLYPSRKIKPHDIIHQPRLRRKHNFPSFLFFCSQLYGIVFRVKALRRTEGDRTMGFMS